MEIKNFIGKTVISTNSGRRFVITNITGPEIKVRSEKVNENGCFSHYCWETFNGDPVSNGYLGFEDESLNEPFKAAYKAYSMTKEARLDCYFYYMHKYD